MSNFEEKIFSIVSSIEKKRRVLLKKKCYIVRKNLSELTNRKLSISCNYSYGNSDSDICDKKNFPVIDGAKINNNCRDSYDEIDSYSQELYVMQLLLLLLCFNVKQFKKKITEKQYNEKDEYKKSLETIQCVEFELEKFCKQIVNLLNLNDERYYDQIEMKRKQKFVHDFYEKLNKNLNEFRKHVCFDDINNHYSDSNLQRELKKVNCDNTNCHQYLKSNILKKHFSSLNDVKYNKMAPKSHLHESYRKFDYTKALKDKNYSSQTMKSRDDRLYLDTSKIKNSIKSNQLDFYKIKKPAKSHSNETKYDFKESKSPKYSTKFGTSKSGVLRPTVDDSSNLNKYLSSRMPNKTESNFKRSKSAPPKRHKSKDKSEVQNKTEATTATSGYVTHKTQSENKAKPNQYKIPSPPKPKPTEIYLEVPIRRSIKSENLNFESLKTRDLGLGRALSNKREQPINVRGTKRLRYRSAFT